MTTTHGTGAEAAAALEAEEAQRIITIRQLLEAGVHFGHRTDRWNPRMEPYIYGARNGVHIIDLQQTAAMFRRAYRFARSVAAEGKPILFVGTKKQAQDVLVSEASRAGQFYVVSRWLGGSLTNAIRSIKLFCTKLADACFEGGRIGKQRAVSSVRLEDNTETIRVTTGGDGPKVEIVSRRGAKAMPTPEAGAAPEEQKKAVVTTPETPAPWELGFPLHNGSYGTWLRSLQH